MISSASAITWLLVTTMPVASMMKPEPSELTRRGGARSALRLALAAAVEEILEQLVELRIVAAACGCWPPRAPTFCEVEMLTTASITCSATSAIASGPRASDGAASAGSMMATVAAANAGWRACRANRPSNAEHGRVNSSGM